MGYFVSYSRRDERAVQVLAADLERTRNPVWMDRELGGGEDWWQEILSQIRRADVFVLALSTNSLRSRPCRAELDYATALGVPVLPVQVDDVDSLRTTAIAEKQVVDYRARVRLDRTAAAHAEPAIDVVVAAADLADRRRELPDPLPAAPPIPFEYLMQIRLAVDAEEIPSRIQLQILTQLKQALREEDDPVARGDVVDLLQRLRRHPDTTYRNAVDVDELLATAGARAEAEPPPQPEPEPESVRTPPPAAVAGPNNPKKASHHLSHAIGRCVDLITTPVRTLTAARLPRDAPPEQIRRPQPAAGSSDGPAASQGRTGVLAALGIGLGAVGIGQLVPLFYDLRDLRIIYGYSQTTYYYPMSLAAYRWISFIILVLTVIGVGLSIMGLRRRQRLAYVALAVSLAGVAVVGAGLLKYIGTE